MAGGTKEQQADAVRRWRARNPRGVRDWNRRHPEMILFKSVKSNAKARGRECGLTLEDIFEITKPMICEATGLPLEWGNHDWAPSIDRLNGSVGYVRDNVRLVSWIYNRSRGKSTDEAVMKMARALVERV